MTLTVESPEGSLVLLEAWTPPPPTGGGPGPASSIIDPLCGETPEGGGTGWLQVGVGAVLLPLGAGGPNAENAHYLWSHHQNSLD